MPVQSSTGMYQESRYIVDATVGIGSPYLTVQSAINAAVAAGIPAEILIRPGIYNENLTLYSGYNLRGAGGIATPTLVINGTHTPPLAGQVSIENVELRSATSVFGSGAAGTSTIVLQSCTINVTNGYTFNLPNWTGSFIAENIGQLGANNGEINNTAGATILYTNAIFGGGTNIANISGDCELFNVATQCPLLFRDAAVAYINGGCWVQETVTLQNTATLNVSNSLFITGIDVAIHTTSAGLITLSNTTIDSAAVNVITGTGSVEFSSVTYVDSTGIAGTITKDFSTRLETGVLKVDTATAGALIATAGVVSALSPLTVGYGGSGLTSITDHAVMVGSAAAAVTPVGPGTTGQLLGGVTGADPSFTQSSDGDFTFTSATATTQRILTISNTDNTAVASPANLQVTVGGPVNTGDPFVNFLVSTAGTYSVGIDNSDSDKFKITASATPSAGTDLFTMTNAGVITLANDLDVSEGGTGVSTLTSHGVLMGNGAGDIQATAEPSNGQILIGKTGDFPQLGQLQPGPGISISSGAGTITVGAWGGGVSWTTKGASTPLVSNNAFICTAGAALSFSLPAASSVGDVVGLTLDGSASWAITQAGGQQIRVGSTQTTAGVGGSITSTAQGDTILLVCSVANSKWNAYSVVGNLIIV